MNRLTGLMIVGYVLILGVSPSRGQMVNPTVSDLNGNTAGGTSALASPPGGAFNTAFGSFALALNTTGRRNTAVGAEALLSNISGSHNTAIGVDALLRNTTASDNTSIGFSALLENTTGEFNTATGAFALQSNTAGDSNTASGASALVSNTTGSDNTATGANALQHNITGGDNTASGAFALLDNTAGNDNTASGANALSHNTTGNFNTASGAFALFNNTVGESNTASGFDALSENITGTSNTALGHQALRNSTGNQNIAIGEGAGSALTSGSNNIYLGNVGATAESQTMRLGNTDTQQTFLAGVANRALPGGLPVMVKTNGKLGTQPSSARYKRDIAPIGTRSAGVLELRPVTFTYKGDEERQRQYGLIAEEVANVYPDLITRSPEGAIEGVRYLELIPMLVNELQRQQQELAELRALVGQLRGGSVAQR